MFFDKFLKKDTEQKTAVNAETEEERAARYEQTAKELWLLPRQYLLLSLERADMRMGIGFPRVNTVEEKKYLQLFTSREALESYAKSIGCQLDGIIPFAVLEETQSKQEAPVEKQSFAEAIRKLSNLNNLCLTAIPLGITDVSIDEGSEACAYVPFDTFLQLGNVYKSAKPTIMLNAAEQKAVAEAKQQGKPLELKIGVRFNPYRMEDYVNDYAVTKERGDALIKQIFGREEKDIFEDFMHNNTLSENCFVSTFIGRSLIPQAKEKKPEDLPFFTHLLDLLSRIAAKKLTQVGALYVMGDKETHDVKDNKGNLVVAYTDRFRYMLGAQFEYMKYDSYDEVMDLAREKGMGGILVTDGPSGCVIRIPVPEKNQ